MIKKNLQKNLFAKGQEIKIRKRERKKDRKTEK
jgi:hypothetical protein